VGADADSVLLGFVQVGMAKEARDVEQVAVPPRRHGCGRVPIEGSGDLAELVSHSHHQVVEEQVLVDDAVVHARAGDAAGVEDELLEVVGIRPATLVEPDSRTAVWVAPVLGEVASERVLTAEGQLAELLSLETDPGVAVEEHVGSVHLASGERVLAFEPEEDSPIRLYATHDVLAPDAPAVAAEP